MENTSATKGRTCLGTEDRLHTKSETVKVTGIQWKFKYNKYNIQL